MNPPDPFTRRKSNGYSLCVGCGGWHQDNQIFHAEGMHWVLCETDFLDYWDNTEVVPEDYKWYNVGA